MDNQRGEDVVAETGGPARLTRPTWGVNGVTTEASDRGVGLTASVTRRRVVRVGLGGLLGGAGVLSGIGSWEAVEARTRKGHFQAGWRFCGKCHGQWFTASGTTSVCPADGASHSTGASAYLIRYGGKVKGEQRNWRYCAKCTGLWFAGSGTASVCPAGGQHTQAGSFNFSLVHGGTPPDSYLQGWRFCAKCTGLWLPFGSVGACPAGGGHTLGSANYSVRRT